MLKPTEDQMKRDIANDVEVRKLTWDHPWVTAVIRALYAEEKLSETEEALSMANEYADRLRSAIVEHHKQKADDRCIEDDDRLYAAAGLPPCDRRVGDKAAMLRNCERFIDRRCEGGHWPSYAELEEKIRLLEKAASHQVSKRLIDSYE